ncbi:MAG TPA: AraC family transcriptional regulator [Gemmatimonadaceae bacterium]
MHRVLEHVDRNLDQPLDLEQLAGVANFSAFHFHRLFAAWMGETLGEYLRRRRVEIGALRLVSQPSASVLRVALSVGFGSAEAFARAFKLRFGVSPTAWRAAEKARHRADSNFDQMVRNPDQDRGADNAHHGATRNQRMEALMNVKLIDRQPVTVAYLRLVGPYGQPVSEFWQDTVYPWMITNNLLGRVRYGIVHDDEKITSAGRLRYDAAVEVPSGFTGTGNFHETVIPGGKYAAARFKGTVNDFTAAWQSLLRDWLPASGMQLDARPFFEHYGLDSTYDPKTGVLECDLCVPVAAL